MNESHGYAIPLAVGLRMSTAVPNILAARKSELCGLLEKTPCSSTSSKHAKRIPNAPYHS
jgi:hypothetical protein